MNLNAYWQDFIQRFDFSAGTLKVDILAGLTVSLVAIPQSLAYAQLAGVPAYYGLYAALIPTIVGALFGSSNQLSTGPVAMTSLLTAASIAPLAAQGTDLFISYVILLALISGFIQIAFGVMRAGIMLNFLSNPVLMGFINAAAIIIGLSQLPTLMGIPFAQSTHFMLDISQVILHIDQLHMPSLGFGLVAILLLVGFKQWAPGLPGVLVTVVVLTLTSFLIDYAGMGGAVVGVVPEGLPTLSVPPLDWQATVTLLPAAFVIALISFMEAMSSCKVISIKTRQPWDENKELIGQGLAKIAAAFCQSMPVSGSFSRSALNLASEAKTPLASIISALFVLITLLFLHSAATSFTQTCTRCGYHGGSAQSSEFPINKKCLAREQRRRRRGAADFYRNPLIRTQYPERYPHGHFTFSCIAPASTDASTHRRARPTQRYNASRRGTPQATTLASSIRRNTFRRSIALCQCFLLRERDPETGAREPSHGFHSCPMQWH